MRKLALAAALTAVSLGTPAVAADDVLKVIGIDALNRLTFFTTSSAADVSTGPQIRGLAPADTTLIGADFRVQDGNLYVVGLGGGIYQVNFTSGDAIPVSQLTVALDAESYGVDFNPAADRLRIVSRRGQNLRHNVNSGGTTLVDDPLDYPPATPVNASGPNAEWVIGSAYTNNDLSPVTATTLFDLDTLRDQVVVQSPPNNGSLAATGSFGGGLNPDTTQASFDIYSKLVDGVTVSNVGYAVLNVGGKQGFYKIDLTTGAASFVKALPTNVVSIAIPLNQ